MQRPLQSDRFLREEDDFRIFTSTLQSSNPPIQDNFPGTGLSDITGSSVPLFEVQNLTPRQDNSRVLGPPQKRRRGGRIYNGCTICRERKIKCDQRRPTCYNCEKSRHHICDGYNDDADKTRTVIAKKSHYASTRAIDSSRDRITSPQSIYVSDQSSPEQDQRQFGNRTSNSVNTDHTRSQILFNDEVEDYTNFTQWADSSTLAPCQDSGLYNFTSMISAQDNFQDIPADSTMLSCISENNTLWGDFDETTNRPQDVRRIRQQAVTTEKPHRLENESENQLGGVLSSLRRRSVARSPSPTVPLVELSRLSKTTRKLLYHYQSHVCQLMMPTAAPSHNPWLKLYLPLAVQEPTTSAKQALLYAILSVADFNQAELVATDSRSTRLQAIEHSKKAGWLVKTIVSANNQTTVKDSLDKQALLAAALTMTTIEVFSGANEGQGYKHLQLAKDVIELTGGINWWMSDPANVTLLQIFRCLRIISYTSGWSRSQDSAREEEVRNRRRDEDLTGLPAMVDKPERAPLPTSSSSSCEYTLDVSFGVSTKTLWCLKETIDLEAIKSTISQGDSWSENHSTDLFKLENELYSLMENPSAFSNQISDSSRLGGISIPMRRHDTDRNFSSFQSSNCNISQIVTEEIKENHVWAFHYSVALFYRRAICNGTAIINPPVSPAAMQSADLSRPTGQYLVSKALEYLENIDALTIDISVANTLWPGFIAAVEAVDTDLRHRALGWFARARRHGIGNIAKAKALVLEVWRRVDRQRYVSHERKNLTSELGPVDWRNVMREKGMYIMLT